MWAYHLGLLKLVAKVYKLFVFPYTFTWSDLSYLTLKMLNVFLLILNFTGFLILLLYLSATEFL